MFSIFLCNFLKSVQIGISLFSVGIIDIWEEGDDADYWAFAVVFVLFFTVDFVDFGLDISSISEARAKVDNCFGLSCTLVVFGSGV